MNKDDYFLQDLYTYSQCDMSWVIGHRLEYFIKYSFDPSLSLRVDTLSETNKASISLQTFLQQLPVYLRIFGLVYFIKCWCQTTFTRVIGRLSTVLAG